GAVVSEYPFGKRADRATFPMRNRIIAGMAMATLLVESGIRGGGMITARIACDLGRDVFAVPGRISEPESAGCHLLIREGARLITSASDIVEELGFSGRLKFSAEPAAKNSESSGGEIVLEGDEAAVYSALKSAGCPLAADEIVQSANLPISKVLAAALMLELKNAIAKQGDGRWTAAPR
ncbi:MAG: DNA-protecting protein DprA, partial [Opitutales bacterium]|nr:DNA-protecting protein DprA [Opitutales bacterium]